MKAVIITPFIHGTVKETVNIEKDDFVICADNSYERAMSEGAAPALIIGDFDSGERSAFPENTEIITVPSEKDDTDTMLCVKEALARGYKKITVVGGIGGRLDHTLANIQALYYGKLHGADITLADGFNEAFIALASSFTVEKKNGYYLSLFAYSGSVGALTVSGTKYTLDGASLDNTFPLGVSNEITTERAEISFESGVLLVVLSKKI